VASLRQIAGTTQTTSCVREGFMLFRPWVICSGQCLLPLVLLTRFTPDSPGHAVISTPQHPLKALEVHRPEIRHVLGIDAGVREPSGKMLVEFRRGLYWYGRVHVVSPGSRLPCENRAIAGDQTLTDLTLVTSLPHGRIPLSPPRARMFGRSAAHRRACCGSNCNLYAHTIWP
jgi:hypothetical protein